MTARKIRGYELESITDAIDANLPHVDKARGVPVFGCRFIRYYIIGDRLIPESRLMSPKVLAWAFPRVIRGKFGRQPIRLGFSCDHIVIKNSIRINRYNKEPISVKIAFEDKGARDGFATEIRARKTVNRIRNSKYLSPKLFAYDSSNHQWLVEELVTETVFPYRKIGRLVRNLLPDLYGATRYYEYLPPEFSQYLDNSDNSEIRAVHASISRDRKNRIPFAFCHGDLTKSNILMNLKGEIYLNDWEIAKWQPVAFDLAKLYVRRGGPRKEILKLIGGLSRGEEDILHENLQMALGLENFLNHIQANSNGKLTSKQKRRDRRGRKHIARLLANAA